MSENPIIQCAKNGPLLVRGLEKLVAIKDGRTYETQDITALCRCGSSGNKPFCDGSHKTAGFSDEKSSERTKDRKDEYAGKAITIHDNRGICAHAGFCTEGWPEVFRMKEEPWIDPDGTSVAEVIKAVDACPSGALGYSIDGVEQQDQDQDARILIAPNGPFAVKGGIDLENVDWGAGASLVRYDLCRCGQSKNKPFCDGSHWQTEFDDG